jgi:membrane-bound lytic murein transglycosylase D
MFLNTKAPNGASGLWQIQYTPAKNYRLNINSFIDERKDFKKSTSAALDYLNDLNKIYNNWLLSIAAYNSSTSTVNKAVRRAKGKMDFWSVYNYLPTEIRDYAPAFIAVVYVMNYYKDYNISPVKTSVVNEADTVLVFKQIHFRQVSKILEIPENLISLMNPVFKNNIIPERTDGFKMALPKGYGDKFYSLKDSIFKYRDSAIVNFIKFPQPPFNSIKADNVKTTTDIIYIVKSGDNLAKISKKYGVSIKDIKKWNRLKSDFLRKGQKLLIYFNTRNNRN